MSRKTFQFYLEVLRVCRALHKEARQLLYSNTVLVLLHTENLQNQSIGYSEIDEALFDSKDDSAAAFKRFRNIKFEVRRHDFDGDDDDDDDEEASSSDVVIRLGENIALALSAASTFIYDRISFNFSRTRDPITASQLF